MEGGAPRPQATRPTGGDLTRTDGFTNAYFLIINRLALLLV